MQVKTKEAIDFLAQIILLAVGVLLFGAGIVVALNELGFFVAFFITIGLPGLWLIYRKLAP